MAKEQKCFIIMPITTPDSMLDKYRDGKDHFKHVLHCLFMPSIQKAGYEPIPPVAKGADLIHAGIVENLETADIVLCDMSCLNPNVFFEFGIRTSINKPVSVVKDELTERVPFDTAILNYHEYKSSLDPWHLEAEVKVLSEHIRASAERSKNENTLWKYFGLKTTAAAYEAESSTEAKLDYLTMKVDSLSKQIQSREGVGEIEDKRLPFRRILARSIGLLLPAENVVMHIEEEPNEYWVGYGGPEVSADQAEKISETFRGVYGKTVRLVRVER
jgi:hypothetical protein